MEVDELTYNSFYLLLREKFRRKYELAVSKCWTICVPFDESLRGLTITESFVDDHILKPVFGKPCHFASTDPTNSRIYKFVESWVQLVQVDRRSAEEDAHRVKIKGIERGYNREFHTYNIVILEKPLDPKYCAARILPGAKFKLNRTINSYKEAVRFLHEISMEEGSSVPEIRSDLHSIDPDRYDSSETLGAAIQDTVRRHWAKTMRLQTLDVQRDVRFQKLLSSSLEILIMHHLHEPIYSLLSEALGDEDTALNEKINRLNEIGATADQLGAKESLAIALPSAIVELAMLDGRQGPHEKLACLRATLDLAVAEVKGALAAVETRREPQDETETTTTPRKSLLCLATDDLIPLLIHVIVRARPQHLITDLHYVQNFLWSTSPHDGLSYTIVTFKTAVGALRAINVKRLPLRSPKVKRELPINEALDVLSLKDDEKTPLDQQVRQLSVMLEESTRNN